MCLMNIIQGVLLFVPHSAHLLLKFLADPLDVAFIVTPFRIKITFVY